MALRLDRTVAPVMSGKEEWRSNQLQQGSSCQISAATLSQGLSGKGVVMSGSLFRAGFVTWQGLQCSIHFCRALPMPGHQALVWRACDTSLCPCDHPAAVPLSLTSDIWEWQFCRHREVNHGMLRVVWFDQPFLTKCITICSSGSSFVCSLTSSRRELDIGHDDCVASSRTSMSYDSSTDSRCSTAEGCLESVSATTSILPGTYTAFALNSSLAKKWYCINVLNVEECDQWLVVRLNSEVVQALQVFWELFTCPDTLSRSAVGNWP